LKKNIRKNNYHVFKVLYIIKIRAFVASILFRVDSLTQKKQKVKAEMLSKRPIAPKWLNEKNAPLPLLLSTRFSIGKLFLLQESYKDQKKIVLNAIFRAWVLKIF
jgi:hypothetical protein